MREQRRTVRMCSGLGSWAIGKNEKQKNQNGLATRFSLFFFLLTIKIDIIIFDTQRTAQDWQEETGQEVAERIA